MEGDDSGPRLKPQPTTGAQSIGRAAALLRLLAAHHAQGIHLQQLVHVTGLQRTTVHRILASLLDAGLASREPDNPIYRLGIEAMAMGMASMRRAPLVDLCRPAMQRLARRAGKGVFLVVRSGDHSHCLHFEPGSGDLPSFADNLGRTRLLGLGIPSFALLARMSETEFAGHCARYRTEYLARGLTERKLQRWVRLERDLGYALVNAQGLGGIGLHFEMGSCGDAALGIVGTSRMSRQDGEQLVGMMREELDRVNGLRGG